MSRDARVLVGALLFAFGLFITVWTFTSASDGGGMYVAAWGPMVVGLRMVVRGFSDDG